MAGTDGGKLTGADRPHVLRCWRCARAAAGSDAADTLTAACPESAALIKEVQLIDCSQTHRAWTGDLLGTGTGFSKIGTHAVRP